MNADLLAMLGGGVPSASASRQEPEGKSILSFKAGKMTTTLQPVSSLQINWNKIT